MTIKRTFFIIFATLFFSSITSMEIVVSDNSNNNEDENDCPSGIYNGNFSVVKEITKEIINIPIERECQIITYLDLQSLGRFKSVAHKYNNWIDFNNDKLPGTPHSISYYLSLDFTKANIALISAAHGEKRDFMQNILLIQQTVKDRWYRKHCLGFIRDEFANVDKVIYMKDYINAYKGIVNRRWKNNEQVLKQAIEDDNIHVARIILSNGNSISEKTQADLLIDAIQLNRKDRLEFLLFRKVKDDRQFDVNSSYKELNQVLYPLYAAVNKVSGEKNGDISNVQLLLDLEARVNQKNSYWRDRTALHNAASGKNIELVKLLLLHGANINQSDKNGQTPLIAACNILFGDENDMISYLLNVPGICVNQRDNDGNTALMYIYEDKYSEIMQLLLNKGVDANIQDKEGKTILHKAAAHGSKEIVKLLLERNVIKDINCADRNGCTPLMCAIHSKNAVEIIQLLLDKGADATIQNNKGQTILHKAVAYDNKEIVKLLLERNTIKDINCAAKNGRTSLMYSIYSHNEFDILLLLLDKGADAIIQDTKGQTVLHRAAAYGCTEAMKLLLEHNVKDINYVDNKVVAIVHIGLNQIKEFLKVHVKDKNGATALHLAAKNGMVDCAQLLLQHKADVNAVDKYGNTALHYIAITLMEDTAENAKKISDMIDLLLKFGGNGKKNQDGKTPFLCALEAGNYIVSKYFMSYYKFDTLSNEQKCNILGINYKSDETPLSFLYCLATKKQLTQGHVKIMHALKQSEMHKMLYDKKVKYEKEKKQQAISMRTVLDVEKTDLTYAHKAELNNLEHSKQSYANEVNYLKISLKREQDKNEKMQDENKDLTNVKNFFAAKLDTIESRANKLIWGGIGVFLASWVAMALLTNSDSTIHKAWFASILSNFFIISSLASASFK